MKAMLPQHRRFSSTQNPHSDGIPIIINDRTCGYKMPDGTYYKRINGSKHIIRKLHGIGFSVDAIAQAESMGATRIRVVDADTSIEYLSTIPTLRTQGIAFNDRVFGAQLVLKCNQFAQRLPNGTLIQPKNTQPKSEQLNMFDEVTE